MRKTFVTREYRDYSVYGTVSMSDKSLFVGKPINVPDVIKLANTPATDALVTLYISRPEKVKGTTDYENLPTWEFSIAEDDMLTAYAKNAMLATGDWDDVDYANSGYNDVNSMLDDYIKNNILKLFKMSKLEMHTLYLPLTDAYFTDETKGSVVTSLLRDKPIKTYKARISGSEDVTLLLPPIKGTRKVQYKQTKSSRNYALLYYMVPVWERI